MTDIKLPELPKDFKNRFDRDYSHIVEHWTKAGAEVWFANELKIYKDRLINEYKASLIKKIEKMHTPIGGMLWRAHIVDLIKEK